MEEDDGEDEEGEGEGMGSAPVAAAPFAPRGAPAAPAAPRVASSVAHAAAAAAGGGTQGSGINAAFLSGAKWSDFPTLSPPIRRALLETFRFEYMSKVQEATLALGLAGDDMFAKAKTGGGKTLGFLIPALERLSAAGGVGRPGAIGILCVSPTRELAQQILEEAKTLATFMPHLAVQCVIGGTNINGERGRMGGPRPKLDILVATPGRCVDHIDSTPGFSEALRGCAVLILDEADRLLDMGFEPQLTKIQACLPAPAPPPPAPGARRPAGRQTLLFSATVPEAVKSVAHRFLRQGYPMVDTVGKDDSATNPQVTQEVLVVEQCSVLPALARALVHIAATNPRHKTVVFLTTARMTGYVATLFERTAFPHPYAPGAPPIRLGIVEMHSRKSQGQRTAAAERFRVGSGLVMFSSDVSARGMDYPGITEVVQVGMTDRESYIHRLGRTARAGREGAGLTILADYEAPSLLAELADLPINPAGPTSELTGGARNGMPGFTPPGGGGGKPPTSGGKHAFVAYCGHAPPVAPPPALATTLVNVGRDPEMNKEACQAYGAALGFYNGCVVGVWGWGCYLSY